jgi:hypothetical protein
VSATDQERGQVSSPPLELTVKELIQLQKSHPDIYREFMAEKKADRRHARWIAWASLIGQVVGHLCGLLALGVLAGVAWHAFDLGDPDQGAAVICTGAVSIVAVFVTGRLVEKPSKPKIPFPNDDATPGIRS